MTTCRACGCETDPLPYMSKITDLPAVMPAVFLPRQSDASGVEVNNGSSGSPRTKDVRHYNWRLLPCNYRLWAKRIT